MSSVGRDLATQGFDPASSTRTIRFAASDYAMTTILPGIVARLRLAAPLAGVDVAHIDADLPDRM